VVDHHVVPEVIPDAVAVIDPLQDGCTFPFKKMAAVGLTFHLLVALRARLREKTFFSTENPEPDLRHYLDVVAVGTVADLVPLQGTNRVLASAGIRQLACTSNAGLQALCMVSGGENKTLDAGFLGFQIGPRINAAGRLTTATKGVELLILDSYQDALEIAQVVDEENRRRRTIEAQIFEEACAQIEAAGAPESRNIFVLVSDSWHPGVTGIVASKLIERYYRPAVLIAMDGEVGKGSGRSISGFHLVDALRQCEDLLENFGGHAHAAGLSLRRENIDALVKRLTDLSAQRLQGEALTPKLHLDEEVELADITKGFLDEIEALAPYGMGNRRPLFTTRSAKVVSTRIVGGSHLQLTLEKGGVSHRCIAFGMGEREPERGALLDVAFRPEWNEWRGNRTIQLHVRDFRPALDSV
jgi:single-stranded-DNA-specific exonuclease